MPDLEYTIRLRTRWLAMGILCACGGCAWRGQSVGRTGRAGFAFHYRKTESGPLDHWAPWSV